MFFRHEGLQDLGPVPMLVFAGLWCQSDRDGRFEWRPRQLKLDILPFLDFEMSGVLDQLATHDFIRRYEVGGELYGYIPTWDKHQFVNNRETKSVLPPPHDASVTRDPRAEDAPGTRLGNYQVEGEGKGREEEGNDASSRVVESNNPEMIAHGVLTELGMSGRYLLNAIADVAKTELNRGRSPTQIRDEMISARRDYDRSVAKLKWPLKPESFFGNGDWRNRATWPWKDGEQGASRRLKTVNGAGGHDAA